jgi:hypothetical protein
MSAVAPEIQASLRKRASKLVNDPIVAADKKISQLMGRVESQLTKQVKNPYGAGYWGDGDRQSPADHMMTLLARNAAREFNMFRTDGFLDPH